MSAQARDRTRSARSSRTTHAVLQSVIDSNAPVQRRQTSTGQFVIAPSGRKITLIDASGKLTKAGNIYYDKLDIEPPMIYDYDQPLINETHALDRFGNEIRVRQRKADGTWKITSAGKAYFKFNRTEYMPNIPVLTYDPLEQKIVKKYIPWEEYTVGRLRSNGHVAGDDIQLSEVRRAVEKELKEFTMRKVQGRRYHVLREQSDSMLLWDEEREITIDQRRNFWDRERATTEVLLGRPLQSWVLPDGMWRPFEMHPDTFNEHDHGCAVQMLYKSFVSRPSGADQRKGIKEHKPTMSIEQIESELEACFHDLGYVEGKYPFEYGWRQDGVPAAMVIQFCKRVSAQNKPLKCVVLHAGHKIAEFVPENCMKNAPICCFQIFGNHSYFFNRGAEAAAVSRRLDAKDTTTIYDEFSNRCLKDDMHDSPVPPFDEWKTEFDFLRDLNTAFDGLVVCQPRAKKHARKIQDAQQKQL